MESSPPKDSVIHWHYGFTFDEMELSHNQSVSLVLLYHESFKSIFFLHLMDHISLLVVLNAVCVRMNTMYDMVLCIELTVIISGLTICFWKFNFNFLFIKLNFALNFFCAREGLYQKKKLPNRITTVQSKCVLDIEKQVK